MFRVAIDTGGTFTDYICVDGDGRTAMTKTPTDRQDPAAGIISGLHDMAGLWGLDLGEFLNRTGYIVHGTTLALNALLESKGACTALLTTDGFRDALEMRRSRRAEQWDLRAPVPPVLVPRRLRLGISERLDYRGQVLAQLDREQLIDVAEMLKNQGVEAVAICFLFSFLNPAHEKEAAAVLNELLPGVFVSTSAGIAPRIREYERTSTTVLNAYLTPVLADYLNRLEKALAGYGWRQPLYLILNSGGLTDSRSVKNTAVKTLLSGPAGGAKGGQKLAESLQRPNLIVADMGGTSFDVATVVNGRIRIIPEAEIAGYPVSLPVTDIRSIGAGGGSIASVDEAGRLMVGPHSAGSNPGPACYSRGGTKPTVTDAVLLLGLIDPDKFLGGRLRLDRAKAEEAINTFIASPLGLSVEEAAMAVYRVAAAKMADAVRLVTVQQGLDPRDFALVAAGGAFPLFAALIAGELEMHEVIVPVQGPVFCAWGMLGTTCQYDLIRSCLMPKTSWDPGVLRNLWQAMRQEAGGELERLNVPVGRHETEVTLEMKYSNQHHEISIVLADEDFADISLQVVDEAFHRRHQELYGYAEPAKPWIIVNMRLVGREKSKKIPLPSLSTAKSPHHAEVRSIMLDSGGFHEARVFGADNIPVVFEGPALVEFAYTTVLVPAGFKAVVEPQGYISLTREEAAQ